MRITMTDYGVGNLHSIKKALEISGAKVDVITDLSKLLDAECIVFPGVGAFDKTMERVLPYREGIRDRILSGVPTLGICVGAQIMFSSSEEGDSPGLGVFDGKVVKIKAECIPHMGWNAVETTDPLFDGLTDNRFYFAHSYHGTANDISIVKGTTEYEGNTFPSFFRTANAYGVQFHPEKSAGSGLKLVENFIRFAEENA
ncbi:MAG: imidazole glycerol phosphate synthase subunit HisH [Candidatus Methanoplasma sp.]|jgi:glutamine amidotransferase|nr:imidazole glycerol phosphate synthase subunit HisH [Candidatus Methanoplasma sp.]